MPRHRSSDSGPPDAPAAVRRIRALHAPAGGWVPRVPQLDAHPSVPATTRIGDHGQSADGQSADGQSADGEDIDDEDDLAAGPGGESDTATVTAIGVGVDPEGPDENPDMGTDPVRIDRRRRWPWSRRIAETWVPETLRDARIDPGRRGALALSLVAALAATAAAIGVWRGHPEPQPVAPIPAAESAVASSGSVANTSAAHGDGPESPAADASGAPEPATGTRPTVIAVSVTGLVRHPGLVHLPSGSRVADAIAAAGGLRSRGSVTGLNLATVLADGDSVVVGARPTGPITGSAPDSVGGPGDDAGAAGEPQVPVDLNSADAEQLQQLPGIGPVTAGNIIDWREANGRFVTVDQLLEVSGIGPATLEELAAAVTIG